MPLAVSRNPLFFIVLLLFNSLFWNTTGNTSNYISSVNLVEKQQTDSLSLSTLTLAQANLLISRAKIENDKVLLHQGYIALGKHYIAVHQLDEALIALNAAYLNALNLGFEQLQHEAIKLLSEVHLTKELKTEALEYLHRGKELSKQLKDSVNLAWYYLRIVEVELETGNLGKAMEIALSAQSFFEQKNDSINLLLTLLNLSSIQNQLGNEQSSGRYIAEAFSVLGTSNNKFGKAKALMGHSQLLLLTEKYSEAQIECEKAIELLIELDEKETTRAESLLGEIFFQSKHYTKAQNVLRDALKKQQGINDQSGQANTYLRLADLQSAIGEWNNAIGSYNLSLKHATNVGLTNIIRQAYKGLSQVNYLKGEQTKAYAFLNHYTRITDSLFNAQKISEATNLEEYAIHQKHLVELQSKDSELEYSKYRIRQQKKGQALLATVAVLFLLIIIFSIREFRHNKQANELLVKQKNEVELQKQLADHKTRNFTDSLNYSQRIQKAILSASLSIQNLFPESFIFLFPKDIVSGDFYWMKEKNDRILFALADCTGHGVPGALMSIIGTFGLNQVVNELNITSPSEILTSIDKIFRDNLIRKKSSEIFDGMDIALCSFNPKTMELKYSGANIPLFICRSNLLPQPSSAISAKGKTHTLYTVKPTKQTIGSFIDDDPFKNHSITMLESDIIYLFSDGYADQFGGDEGRKFKSSQLYKLLVGISGLPIDKQQSMLEKTFTTWKGDLTQLDDVSFMGIRF